MKNKEEKLFFNSHTCTIEKLAEPVDKYYVKIDKMPKKNCNKCHGIGRDTFYYENNINRVKREITLEKLGIPCKCLFNKKKEKKTLDNDENLCKMEEKPDQVEMWEWLIARMRK